MPDYAKQRQRKTPPHVSLGDLRAVSGKTLDQVCEAMTEALGHPFTRGALSAIENGHRGASTEVLAALELAYGLRPGSLVTNFEPRRREAIPA
jgi:transcriptional regulator with XRE-family HTH domain